MKKPFCKTNLFDGPYQDFEPICLKPTLLNIPSKILIATRNLKFLKVMRISWRSLLNEFCPSWSLVLILSIYFQFMIIKDKSIISLFNIPCCYKFISWHFTLNTHQTFYLKLELYLELKLSPSRWCSQVMVIFLRHF